VAAYTTSGVNVGILQGAIPVFVLIGAFLVYRTPVTRLQMAGVVLAFGGVVVVASGGDLANLLKLSFNVGDILMIVACVLYSGYTVGLRRRPQVSAMGMFTVMAGAAFLASLPMVAVEIAMGQFQAPSLKGWIIALLVTLFPSFLAQLSFIHAVKLIGPGRAGVMVNLAPVFAAGMAVLILGEPFRFFHGTALALVLGGILLSERGKPRG
jgi:drug/metabolite transporter (DMT)-like permease